MPNFYRAERPEDGEEVRRDTWTPEEKVYLRPAYTIGMYRAMSRQAPVPEGMTRAAFNALPADERRDLIGDDLDSAATGVLMIQQMIIGWTFRYPPTKEQKDAGQPGDLVPITDATIDELEPEDFRFLYGEVQKRMKGLTTGPADPEAEEVPLSAAEFPQGPGTGHETPLPA